METARNQTVSGRLSIFALALGVLVVVVGGAFAAGYLIGRILL